MRIKIGSLAKESGVRFGTSGARGLVKDMTDFVCYSYTRGFIQFLESTGDLKKKKEEIAVAGDLRESTPRIEGAVFKAIMDAGYKIRNCGLIPTPAVALYGLNHGMPSIMITGSHIPSDRNGIKYNKKAGEVLKSDETMMLAEEINIDEDLFDEDGMLKSTQNVPPDFEEEAKRDFINRYIDFFAKDILYGKKIVVYQHSAVGRDMVVEVLKKLGAQVVPVGRVENFIPLDTEAIEEDNLALFRKWAKEYKCDAVISTDGDSDRPLVCDENGEFVRGDVLGILVAKFLGAERVVTTASVNSAVEKSGFFKKISRVKIGSPYVVAEMMNMADSSERVVGYEANGGFLIQSNINANEKTLQALPTRDSFIAILSVLAQSAITGEAISRLVAGLPSRFTHSEHIENVPTEKSRLFIENNFATGDDVQDKKNIDNILGKVSGKVLDIVRIDGVRGVFENEEIIHIRPSGNAPELRVYTEADTKDRAKIICEESLRILKEKIV